MYEVRTELPVILNQSSKRQTEYAIGQAIRSNTNAADQSNQIVKTKISKDGIEAYYPVFIGGGTEEQLSAWNEIIKKDFDQILKIYSFQPYPTQEGASVSVIPTILKIDYVIERNDKDYFSVLYKATYQSPYIAHPTELVYTTNIDKLKNVRLRLPDMITVNRDFAINMLNWKLVMKHQNENVIQEHDQLQDEILAAMKDYVKNITYEDFLLGLSNADQIGTKNLYGYYSYLTPDRLGISISVPNYIGDHLELEQELSELKPYLKIRQK